MLGKNDCIGIAPDGITDPVATCRDAPEPLPQDPRPPRPACVIVPDRPGEQPLAGDAAFESLDGRGWDPRHSRSRQPVLPLLLNLEGGQGVAASEAGSWLAAHVRAVSPVPTARHIIAVPDRLGELGQQRLLDALRRANISAELLWRPIATVLGWACRLSARDIDSLQQKSVLVVHLGFWAPEVSRFELEVKHVNEDGTRWLVPIRTGRGSGLPADLEWPVERVARELLAVDLGLLGCSSDLVGPEMTWLTSRPWAALCGSSPGAEIIRDRTGRWHRLNMALALSHGVAAMVRVPIQAMLRERVERGQSANHILLDGALMGLNVGSKTLGDQLAQDLREWMRAASIQAQVVRLEPSVAASGAAHYGWRRRVSIPGYYDTVPELSINALKDSHPAFISLLPGQQRVTGGQKLGPIEVGGFAIGAGTEALDYYLARSDEPTVRLTKTDLPERPEATTPVKLIVTQTPGQGFASVEIRPLRGGSLGARTVFLDWRSMTDTGKKPEEVLQELSVGIRLAYPDPVFLPCHAAVWKANRMVDVSLKFMDAMATGAPDADKVTKLLLKRLGQKQSLDRLLGGQPGGGNKAGIFDSDGRIPDEADLCARLGTDAPFGYQDYRSLADAVLRVADELFSRELLGENTGTTVHGQLMLIGGWSYLAAPKRILDHVRAVIEDSAQGFSQSWINRALNVAGRSFQSRSDARILGQRCAVAFEATLAAGSTKGLEPLMRAMGFMLSHRADAASALDRKTALALANSATTILDKEKERPKRKFFAAAQLLMGLLRYRREDPLFLSPDSPEYQECFFRTRIALEDAISRCEHNADIAVSSILDDMLKFLLAQGTNRTILIEIGDRADADEADESSD